MGFHAYLIRRLLLLVPLLLGTVLLAFVVSHAVPADPLAANVGTAAMSNPEIVAAFYRKWGLDQPLHVQFFLYLKGLLRGDLGVSIFYHRPVAEDLAKYLPATLELATAATLFSVGLAIPFGVLSAVKSNTFVDHILRVVSLIGVSTPIFWLALMSMNLFYFRLGWAPAPGRLSVGLSPPSHITGLYTLDSILTMNGETLVDALQHLALPAFVLGFATMGLVVRVLRSCMLEVLGQDYVRTARAKGISDSAVLFRHVFKNALIPTVTVIGLTYGNLLSGAVVTETIFSWTGVGRYGFQTAAKVDFPGIMGVTLVLALIYILVNTVVDLTYGVLDPRIRWR
jgi:peptide/nickel transport system permease protein